MSVARSFDGRRRSTRRSSAIIRQFMESSPVITAGAVSSVLTSRHDLIVEDDFKKVFDAVCAVDEHKQGHVLPTEVSEIFRLLGCQDDPSVVKRCSVMEWNGRIDLVQVLRIFFPSCPPSTIEKLLPPWARPQSSNSSSSGGTKPVTSSAGGYATTSASTLLRMLDDCKERGYVTAVDLEAACHGIDKDMLREMIVCCSDEAAQRRAADMDVFRTKRLVDLFIRAKLPPGLATVRTSPYVTLFTLGSSWSAVRGPLMAALPSLQLQTRLAALAVFVHRHGPLAAFKVNWSTDLEAPVPGFSVYVDMCTSLSLAPRPPIDPQSVKLGPQQLEKLLDFAHAKDAQALLGVAFNLPNSSSSHLQMGAGPVGIVQDLKKGLELTRAIGVGEAVLLGGNVIASEQQDGTAANPVSCFTVKHSLKLPRPNYLVRSDSRDTRPHRAVTPDANEIDEREWESILAASASAAVPKVDPARLAEERQAAHRRRNEELATRWHSEHKAAPSRKEKKSDAERKMENILVHGYDGATRNFLQTLEDAAKLTYCSNVLHASDEMVVVEPTAHTPRAPRLARPRTAPTRGAVGGGVVAVASTPRQRPSASTPRIGSGLAHHRPLKHAPPHALRSMWSREKWAYETNVHGD